LKIAGADVSAQIKDGWTPMHYAALNGQVYAIEALKKAGANVSAQNNAGQTAMYYAVQKGHIDVVKALRDRS
jgi:hypothetical protein